MANAFHLPADAGTYSIALSQVDKSMTFTTTGGTFLSTSRVVICSGNDIVKTYTVGDGISLSGDLKQLILTFNGSDFKGYEGTTLNASSSFITEGDVEVTFNLEVKKSKL